MASKRFVLILVSCLYIFFLANVALWQSWVRDVFLTPDGHGSMARLSGIRFSKPEITRFNYEEKHTEFADYALQNVQQSFDAITIGNSFSNGVGGNYYQDYLVDRYHWSILNVRIVDPFGTAVQTLYALDDLGYLDEIRPKIVIIEMLSAGVTGFGNISRSAPAMSRQGFIEAQGPTAVQKKIQQDISGEKIAPAVMVMANWRFLAHRAYAWTHPGHKPSESICALQLTRPCFSNPGMENLLVYPEVRGNRKFSDASIEAGNKGLNALADYLKQKGISLVFLPMVDKYDLYYPYIKDKDNLQEENIFAQLMKYPRDYVLIDTKTLLRRALEKEQIKDLYWADDDHYSWKAQQIIGDEIVRQIQP